MKKQILTWNEIREEVRQVNSEFADILNSLDLKEEPEFCRVDYSYGTNIFSREILSKFISDNKHSSRFSFGCDNKYPLGMVLNKSVCASIETKKQFVPLYVFYPGQFFGCWELFDHNHTLLKWNLYSGSRSLFSTAKISNASKYRAIKQKFNLKSKPPKYLKDHHILFRELANHPSSSSNWTSTVLFFSKHLQEQLLEKSSFFPLRVYLHEYAWKQSRSWRSDAMMSIVWNQASDLLRRNQFKNFALQLSILKHITKAALGALPCFISNDPNEMTAPLNLIKEVLIDEYKIDFCPTIMVPGHLTNGSATNSRGYYSVNESIPVEDTYTNKTKKTSIETMRSIYEIYEFLKTRAFNFNNDLNNDVHVDNEMIKFLTNDVKLDFFHSIFDQIELLQMSSVLPDQDQSLTQLPPKYGKSVLPFNDNGSFFRGLIRINVNKPSL